LDKRIQAAPHGTLTVQAFPLSDAQAYMGHADIATTMIYVHHIPEVDAAERFSRLVEAANAPQGQAAVAVVVRAR